VIGARRPHVRGCCATEPLRWLSHDALVGKRLMNPRRAIACVHDKNATGRIAAAAADPPERRARPRSWGDSFRSRSRGAAQSPRRGAPRRPPAAADRVTRSRPSPNRMCAHIHCQETGGGGPRAVRPGSSRHFEMYGSVRRLPIVLARMLCRLRKRSAWPRGIVLQGRIPDGASFRLHGLFAKWGVCAVGEIDRSAH